MLTCTWTVLAGSAPGHTASRGGEWPMFLFDKGRSGFNSGGGLSTVSARRLHLQWSTNLGGGVSAQPVLVGDRLYVGSWNGDEYALTLGGRVLWKRFLGTTSVVCDTTPVKLGVASTPAVTMSGGRPILVVGGGDAALYALDAGTGRILWRQQLGTEKEAFMWSSPVIFGGDVYMGVSSVGDCPLVSGALVQLDLQTGAIRNTFSTVPQGCPGGGVWSSPAVDAANGTLYFATGNHAIDPPECYGQGVFSNSVIELRMSDLSLVGSWQIPASQDVNDGDFGASPTFFTATVRGSPRPMLGLASKNGIYYAFQRGALASGPVWQVRIGVGGALPGVDGPIASSEWDGTTIYAGAGHTTIRGQRCSGSMRALRPADGSIRWQRCLRHGAVFGSLSGVPGIVEVNSGRWMMLIDARSGATLSQIHSPRNGKVVGPATIAGGRMYQGDLAGWLYAFRPA